MGSRRGYAVVALAAAFIVIGAGVASSCDATPVRREATRIEPDELRSYPPLLLVWGDRIHITQTGAADLYVARADGTNVRVVRAWPDRLEDGRVYGVDAAKWSPDGKQIALMLSWWCGGDPCRRLARISSDGSGLRKVTVPADILNAAAWSSDWRAVLTTFNGDELWTVSMAGGKATRIWRSRTRANDVDWSPRGRHLVVTTGRGLLGMTGAGKDVVSLTRWPSDVVPQWSPDGRKIAFIREPRCYFEDECSTPTYIYVVGRDGRELRRVTSTAGAESFLWSPDGRFIAFTTDDSTDDALLYGINRVGANGRGRRVLTSGHSDDLLTWSPDGGKIFFARKTGREGGMGEELWVMDADGGRQTRLPLFHRRWWILSAEWRP